MMHTKTILTIGNPNSGKTTLFNSFTGSRQHVGNWAGVTVEKKTGEMVVEQKSYELIDLPGLYTLENQGDISSLDENIAVQALQQIKADLILNVIDAACLERGLFLTLQLIELGLPIVVILNKIDLVSKQGFSIDQHALSENLGCSVICLSAKNKQDIANCKNKISKLLNNQINNSPLLLDYGTELEQAIHWIKANISDNDNKISRVEALSFLGGSHTSFSLSSEQQAKFSSTIHPTVLNEADLHIANVRYSYIANLCKACRTQVKSTSTRITDKLDKFILHPLAGIPFFMLVMYLMFMFSINIGSAFIDFFDIAVGAILVDGSKALLSDYLPIWLMTLLAEGIGGGIQTVATFIPVIACLYLFMSLLESSGYMARAAFVLDKTMRKIGLPGKAFVPLVLGFGCNVPAIMATRTLEQERERRLAAAMAPFMSCGARLPVYALFAAAFFPTQGQNLVFLLYLIGILAAIFTGIVLRKTLFEGTSDGLLMEIPQYEIPRAKDVWLKTWHKLRRFVFGAGKTIVIVVTMLSFFDSIGTDGSFGNQHTENSLLSKAAKVVTPIFAPIGIENNNWQATVGIITGIFAKEAVIGTLNSLYASKKDTDEAFDLLSSLKEAVTSIPDNLMGLNFADPLGLNAGDLPDKASVAKDQKVDISIFANLNQHFTPASAFAYLIFILLYTPCVAAMGAYVREFGKSFAYFIAGWTMLLAIVFAIISYQLLMIFAQPVLSIFWIIVALCLITSAIALLHKQRNNAQHWWTMA